MQMCYYDYKRVIGGKLKVGFKTYLQYSSQILKHLCDFPLANVDLGLQSSQCSKIRVAQHWGREEHIWVRTISVKGEYKKLGENSTQMASVSTICDEYCSLSAVLNSQCVPDSVLVYLVLVTNSNKTSSPSWFDSHAVIVVVQQQVEVY